MKQFFINGFALLAIFIPILSFGYEEISVVNGGTLTGTVTLKGPIPAPAVFLVKRAPFSKYCEKISDGQGNVILNEYNIGEANTLQDTIVAVQRVLAGKRFEPIRANFFATNCMFHPDNVPHHEMHGTDQQGKIAHVHPLVTVFQDHQPISVINQDPIFHNAQVFQQDTGRVLLNFPIHVSDRPIGGLIHFEKGKKWVQMICGMHEYMQAYGMVVDNPYYAKTKRDGRFVIDKLPQGNYQVVAWHPHFKPITKEIAVLASGGAIALDFEFESEGVRPRVFESADGLHSDNFKKQFN
jgi:hypothetical protein